jgi:hypothetical protein
MASQHKDHADDTDYIHGQMDTTEQSQTYNSFLVGAQWVGVLIASLIACLALIWGAHIEWMPAVLGCGALAIGAGLGMKMGRAFTITGVMITIVGLIAGGMAALVGMFS